MMAVDKMAFTKSASMSKFFSENYQSKFFLEFDFDYFLGLAQTNPEKFERKRKELIDRLLMVYQKKDCKQAEILQSRIDLERRRHKSAMGSCIKIQQMMLDMFHLQFRPALNHAIIDIHEVIK